MDNASNNDTMMAIFEVGCHAECIAFSAMDSCMRCMPHSIHLAAIKVRSQLPSSLSYSNIYSSSLKQLAWSQRRMVRRVRLVEATIKMMFFFKVKMKVTPARTKIKKITFLKLFLRWVQASVQWLFKLWHRCWLLAALQSYTGSSLKPSEACWLAQKSSPVPPRRITGCQKHGVHAYSRCQDLVVIYLPNAL